jgi:hypothetical protein
MKKLITVILLLISSVAYSQKNYICAGTGIFFNSPISDWKNTMGANIEYGKYLKSGIAIGINFGYWSFIKGTEFNGLKITFPIHSNDYYCFSFSGGINYFYSFKDILLEYDFNSNIYVSKDKSVSLVLNYCRQSGLGYDKAESFNFGINKDF